MSEAVKLYHGSHEGICGAIRPDRSDGACDFGRGFYMGTERNQPQTLICEDAHPVLYTVSLDLTGLNVWRFATDEEWALFVAFNRGKLERYRGRKFFRMFEEIRQESDVIVGRIADDRMYESMQRFFDGLFGLPSLVRALSALNIGNQYCAVSQRACSQISIVDEHVLSAAECAVLKIRRANQRKRGADIAARIAREHRREGDSMDEIAARWIPSRKGAAK